MTLCGQKFLVKATHGEKMAATLKCKRWSCPDCAPMRRARVRRECKLGKPNRFITLTSNPKAHASPDDAAQALVKAWRVIRKRYAKMHRGEKLQFMAVFERTKSGWPHLHITARCKFISQRLLSRWMKELTDAPICDVRQIKGDKMAAAYVAKYLGKDPHAFEGVKRYWRSIGYFEKPKKPDWMNVFDSARAITEVGDISDYISAHRALGWGVTKRGGVWHLLDPSIHGPPWLPKEEKERINTAPASSPLPPQARNPAL